MSVGDTIEAMIEERQQNLKGMSSFWLQYEDKGHTKVEINVLEELLNKIREEP